MFGLVAAITTGAWSLFTESAIHLATTYDVGRSSSQSKDECDFRHTFCFYLINLKED